jgi:hypothetical protein
LVAISCRSSHDVTFKSGLNIILIFNHINFISAFNESSTLKLIKVLCLRQKKEINGNQNLVVTYDTDLLLQSYSHSKQSKSNELCIFITPKAFQTTAVSVKAIHTHTHTHTHTHIYIYIYIYIYILVTLYTAVTAVVQSVTSKNSVRFLDWCNPCSAGKHYINSGFSYRLPACLIATPSRY